ncbi:unnamed protein product [Protopolystoma xenopodis]|uniref:Uncharacterized protein n=1 Tax=Protopolystoma xenopodis TaxID=117903 RepID=A0A3S5B214_9PLAT|nr:unnamed protein product [Protopolystoma xenopodis]
MRTSAGLGCILSHENFEVAKRFGREAQDRSLLVSKTESRRRVLWPLRLPIHYLWPVPVDQNKAKDATSSPEVPSAQPVPDGTGWKRYGSQLTSCPRQTRNSCFRKLT